MKIKHKSYKIDKRLTDLRFPCVLWFVIHRNTVNCTTNTVIPEASLANEIILAIQDNPLFVDWLGWETIESYNEATGRNP